MPSASSRPWARKIGSAALPPRLPGMAPPWTDGPIGAVVLLPRSIM